MKQLVNLSRGTRWAVPAGAVVVVGGVLAGSMITVASAAPSLPQRTPSQLLASLAGKTAPPMTGTIVETSSLGLPSLPGTSNPTSLSSLLTGSHTIRIYYSDPTHFRLSVPQSMSESDLIRNGGNAWYWESTKNTVTHLAIPAGAKAPAKGATNKPSSAPPMTPQQAANEVLAKVGATTTVSSDTNVTVAGWAAYQLVLAPKSASSLIGQIRIAVDGSNDVPLRVQVFAKGAQSPAAQIGFTSVSFVEPASSNFAFSPPAGATVKQETTGGAKAGPSGTTQASGAYTVGQDWLTVADLPSSVLSSVTGNQATGSAGSGLSGDTGPVIGALLKSATPVSGSWGSGRLLATSLISMLMTSNGRVLVGAVTPQVLYQAAAQPAPAHSSQVPSRSAQAKAIGLPHPAARAGK
jgi:outer membrane lipoprotein-sorting protein